MAIPIYKVVPYFVIWEERKSRLYGNNACAHSPRPQSPIGDLGDTAGRSGKRLCQGGKPGTGKLNTDVHVCLSGSAHTSGCVVDGLGATASY